jgi:hypothetical protein
MHKTYNSRLEKLLAVEPISIGLVITALPGCKNMYNGIYREIIDNAFSDMAVMKSDKFSSIAALYANEESRRSVFAEYMLTEYWGGKFIADYIAKHPSIPNQQLLRRHADDEIVHSKIFGNLIETSLNDHLHSDAYAVEAGFHAAYERWVGDDFFAFICLLHGFELRSAVIQTYWFAIMEMFPFEESYSLRETFAKISTDEVFHVTYTMQIICDALSNGADASILTEALKLASASWDEVQRMT